MDGRFASPLENSHFSVVFGTSNSCLTQKLPRNILARGRIAIAITITSFGLSKLHKSGGGRNADAACVNAALPVDYLGFAVMRPDGVLL